MGRLIDADALLESFRKCYSGHLGMENSDAMMMFRSICKIINNEPTAYNVEKVVEQLEDMRECEDSGTCNYCQYRWCQLELLDADETIKIVRNGGKE